MSKIGIRERQKIARQNAILDAAREISLEFGYDSMTMEMVADRAMVTKPTLYSYFPNKRELVVATTVRSIRQANEEALREEVGLSPVEKCSLRIGHRLRDKFSSIKITVAKPDEPILSHPDCIEALEELIGSVAEIVREGQKSGDMHPDLHPILAAYCYASVIGNPGFEQIIGRELVTIEATKATIVAMLCRGIKGSIHAE